MPKAAHPIETIFRTIKKWFASTSGPGLAEADRSREQVHRVAPKPAIVGGIDEPGLRPLTRGETTHEFMSADGSYETVAFLRCSPRAIRRVKDRIVCKRRELMN